VPGIGNVDMAWVRGFIACYKSLRNPETL